MNSGARTNVPGNAIASFTYGNSLRAFSPSIEALVNIKFVYSAFESSTLMPMMGNAMANFCMKFKSIRFVYVSTSS